MKNPAKTFEVSIAADTALGFVPTQSVPVLLQGGDRVNAELQRAPAPSEMRQVGVPALAGLSAIRKKATSTLQPKPNASRHFLFAIRY